MDYCNMDLELFGYSKKYNVERYSVRVEFSPLLDQKISEATPMRIPKGFRSKLHAIETRALNAAELRELGKTLGQMLFPKPIQDAVRDNLNAIGSEVGLRIRLKLDSFALADLPWEYAYLPSLAPVGELALNGRISLVRYELTSGTKTALQPLGEDALRLAALLADPKGSAEYAELHLDIEEAKIKAALSNVTSVVTNFQPRATVELLNKALASRPHILHFAGHGKFERTMGPALGSYEGKGYLVLLGEAQKPREFEVDRLVTNLQGSGVRLAVLGACGSE